MSADRVCRGFGQCRPKYRFRSLLVVLVALGCFVPAGSTEVTGGRLPDVIDRVRPGIVGVGTAQWTRRPPARLAGTGFVVGEGHYVLTNAHVVGQELDQEQKEFLAIFTRGEGNKTLVREVEIVVTDARHDIALLKILGPRMPALKLGDSRKVREGDLYAFTGFPIGMVLGMRPVTHRGIVSAITPIAIPQMSSRQLDTAMIRRLEEPFDVFQLDATAYPGNSGSPLFDPNTGEVVGILNMVFVKETKERVLDKPSGISYAIPIHYAKELMRRANLQP